MAKLQNELVQLKLKYESSLQTNETLEHALAIKKEALPIVENHQYENEMQRIRKMFAQRQNEKKKGPIISFL